MKGSNSSKWQPAATGFGHQPKPFEPESARSFRGVVVVMVLVVVLVQKQDTKTHTHTHTHMKFGNWI